MTSMIRKIAISTGGGDAPGLNATIRAVTLTAMERGIEVWGITHGFRGLLEPDTPARGPGLIQLDRDRVRGIMHLGGTILGTANRGNPFSYPTRPADGGPEIPVDRSAELVQRFHEHGFEALVAVGGDGSLRIAHRLHRAGIGRVIGVPKTIDNDVRGTDVTFGFDTAVSIASDAINRIHTTAEAHERVIVVEVMGRNAGFIALHAGLAGGADAILIPEVPFRYEAVAEKVLARERRGRTFSIVVAAEGAAPAGGQVSIKQTADAFRGAVTLGGIAERVAVELGLRTGKEARSLVLGHLQRGGSPTNFDRILAMRFGAAAVRFLAQGVDAAMVALRNHEITLGSLEEAANGTKSVPLDADTILTGREMGICFGDEPPGCFMDT